MISDEGVNTLATVLTKPGVFPPIPARSMIVDKVNTRPRRHLPNAHADGVNMSPPTLGVFEIRLRRVAKEVEVEI